VDGIAGLADLILVAAVGALAAARHIFIAGAHVGDVLIVWTVVGDARITEYARDKRYC
jgi:hypothetical protein